MWAGGVRSPGNWCLAFMRSWLILSARICLATLTLCLFEFRHLLCNRFGEVDPYVIPMPHPGVCYSCMCTRGRAPRVEVELALW